MASTKTNPDGGSEDTSPNDSGLKTPTPQTVRKLSSAAPPRTSPTAQRQQAPQPGPSSRPAAPTRGLLSFSRPRGDAGLTMAPSQQPPTVPKAAPAQAMGSAGGANNKYGYTSPPRSSRRLSSARAPPNAANYGAGRGIPVSRPPPAPNAGPAGKGMIASSLDLVFSYSRSQAFFGDNLPSSPSFVARYRRPDYKEGDEEEGYSSFMGTESDEEEYSDEEADEDTTDDLGEHISLADSQSPERPEDEPEAQAPAEVLPPNATGKFANKRPGRRRPSAKASGRPSAGRPSGPGPPTSSSADEQAPRSASDGASDAYDADDNSADEQSKLLPTSDEAQGGYGTVRRPSGANLPRPSKKLLQDLHAQATPEGATSPDTTSRTPPFANSSQISARLIEHRYGSSPNFDAFSTGTSTFGQTLFNSFNVLCGVGILSEPLAFASAGWIAGGILLAFCGLITNYT